MPNFPYFYEVNWQLVTRNGSLTPICSISKRSLSPRLTVYRNLMIPYLQFTKCAGFLIEFLFLHFFFSGLTSIFGVFHSSKFIDLFLCFPILLISLTMFGSFWFVLGLKNKNKEKKGIIWYKGTQGWIWGVCTDPEWPPVVTHGAPGRDPQNYRAFKWDHLDSGTLAKSGAVFECTV